ncbi:winged helix-turn-helix transcriptional regulator [Schleiferilactobacillus shenzhenensis]|uniref:HxlR n=1 Tax=Schleiferilactobacillus shenzhenensis LY-73 TaxID=1231336 RepID=U4TWU3_9LACO|nr:helix-turn-helix domain-containing protein [Schleiferilactobacillus shenzhenensis]ERL66298.1 HxlR [Schleiferilactobacillus shenzhenensis LY-73]
MTDAVRKSVQEKLAQGDFSCTKEFTLAMFSGKWKIVILCNLYYHGPFRFNELMRLLPRVSHKVLASQLRELQEDQLIDRTTVPGAQPEVYYAISPVGRSLMPVIDAMHEWGDQRLRALRVQPQFNINQAAENHR